MTEAYLKQLGQARQLLKEKGPRALENPHAMVGRTCGCKVCFCCAALQVLNEYNHQRKWFQLPVTKKEPTQQERTNTMTTIEMLDACKQLQAKLGVKYCSIVHDLSLNDKGVIVEEIKAYHELCGHGEQGDTVDKAVVSCVEKGHVVLNAKIEAARLVLATLEGLKAGLQ